MATDTFQSLIFDVESLLRKLKTLQAKQIVNSKEDIYLGHIATPTTKKQAINNCIYVNPADRMKSYEFVQVGEYIYKVTIDPNVQLGNVALNTMQHSGQNTVMLSSYTPPHDLTNISELHVDITFKPENSSEVISSFIKMLDGHIITRGQKILFDYQGHLQTATVHAMHEMSICPISRGRVYCGVTQCKILDMVAR